ncbi:hypothetical protein J132_04729 [Termitomyces sp. J132]|nr:hypothetical protein J132_04729 [Termitomyces sp. J132]
MLQRGIHNVFHLSLLQLHVPNNDRWAADKIVSHLGSKTDTIFEVLWHAGNKTWLVRELDLLSPYFAAQDINEILELEKGTGSPPVDDPQVHLGSMGIKHINTTSRLCTNNNTGALPSDFVEYLSLSHSLSPSLPLHQHSLSVMSSYHPKNHYNPHLSLAMHANEFVQLTSINPNIIIHLSQLLKFIEHNNNICCCNVTIDSIEPCSYTEFTTTYNNTKGDNPCNFITCDLNTGLYKYDSFPIPPSVMTFPNCDPCYAKFHTFGIISANDDIN